MHRERYHHVDLGPQAEKVSRELARLLAWVMMPGNAAPGLIKDGLDDQRLARIRKGAQ